MAGGGVSALKWKKTRNNTVVILVIKSGTRPEEILQRCLTPITAKRTQRCHVANLALNEHQWGQEHYTGAWAHPQRSRISNCEIRPRNLYFYEELHSPLC